MRYYEAMRRKDGFDNGNDVPPDADAVREAYVRWLNHYAAVFKSSVRAYAYEGKSANPCLICFTNLRTLIKVKLKVEDLTDTSKTEALSDAPELEPDSIMDAILAATDENDDRDYATELAYSAAIITVLPQPNGTQRLIDEAGEEFEASVREMLVS